MLNLESLIDLAEKYRPHLGARVREFSIGTRSFAFNTRPALMGVINLSRDSWYRESVCLTAGAAIQRGKVLSAQGADVIDLGAESTLAHAAQVDPKLQLDQLQPVIRGLSEAGILVSVETYDAKLARQTLEAGASVINLTGPEQSPEIYRMTADRDAAVIICYVEGPHARKVGDLPLSEDPIPRMLDFFQKQIDLAQRNGQHRIVIDPGLGFYYRNLQDSAQRVRYQIRVFLESFRLRALGCPVCHALPHAFDFFQEEVRSAEPFFAVLAAFGKTDLLRTHEVAKVKAVVDSMRVY